MKRLIGSVLAALTLVAACGDDDDAGAATTTDAATTETTDAGTTTVEGTPEAAFPVTIEHAFGSTTFDAPPARIATLGMQWTDVVLALGEEPIAHVAEPPAGEGGIYRGRPGCSTARPDSP